MKGREIFKIVLPFVIVAFLSPIILDLFVFGNSFPSNLDNANWAGFLGSFWGAIIGAGCTWWAVVMQKRYADEQRCDDAIVGIRPYIVAVNPIYTKSSKEIELFFDVQNIGLNSACDIEIYARNYDRNDELIEIDSGKYCLTVNSSVSVKPKFNFADTIYYEFHYYDLKSNHYCQEFRYDESTNSFRSLEPVIR